MRFIGVVLVTSLCWLGGPLLSERGSAQAQQPNEDFIKPMRQERQTPARNARGFGLIMLSIP
jgi:hypothetical protein